MVSFKNKKQEENRFQFSSCFFIVNSSLVNILFHD